MMNCVALAIVAERDPLSAAITGTFYDPGGAFQAFQSEQHED